MSSFKVTLGIASEIQLDRIKSNWSGIKTTKLCIMLNIKVYIVIFHMICYTI